MFALIAIPIVIGIILGIKFAIGWEIVGAIVAFVVAGMLGAGKEMDGLIPLIAVFFCCIGMLIGNIHVLFAYPTVREDFFNSVGNAFRWVSTPNAITQTVEPQTVTNNVCKECEHGH